MTSSCRTSFSAEEGPLSYTSKSGVEVPGNKEYLFALMFGGSLQGKIYGTSAPWMAPSSLHGRIYGVSRNLPLQSP